MFATVRNSADHGLPWMKLFVMRATKTTEELYNCFILDRIHQQCSLTTPEPRSELGTDACG